MFETKCEKKSTSDLSIQKKSLETKTINNNAYSNFDFRNPTLNMLRPVQRAEYKQTQVLANERHSNIAGGILPIQKKSNKTGLPDNLKSGMEAMSGYSLDNVRVHYNSPKPAQLNSYAYAQGSNIHVSPGQEKHLPHEAWHTIQQKQGRVQPTTQIKGINLNDNKALEHEADVMGQRALNTSPNTQTQLKKADNIMQQVKSVMQSVPWTDTDVIAEAALSPKLRDGYTLAQNNPTVKPVAPDWLNTRVDTYDGPALMQLAEDIANRRWQSLPQNIQNTKDEINFIQQQRNFYYPQKLREKTSARWQEAKWNVTWNNKDLYLPIGNSYSEYYAEPEGAPTERDYWGQNRIIRSTDTPNCWWATSDHYNNFKKIT